MRQPWNRIGLAGLLISPALRRRLLAVALLWLGGIIHAQIATTTTLTSVTPAAPLFGQAVMLTAQVLPATASGPVSFMDRGVLVGVGTLNTSGIAEITTISLPAGIHSMRAVYGGGVDYFPSQSAAQPYSVTAVRGFGLAAAVNYSAGTEPSSVAVGDFNGDGKADLAVANYGSNNVSVLLGNGNGTFQAALNYAVGASPQSIAVGDFDGDGKADLAVANYGSNNVSVLLGNGNGTFQAVVNYTVGASPQSIAVGDFNLDGKADLAVANNGSNNVSVLLGNGDGTLHAALNYAVGTGPQSIAVGDFNGDGKADLAVANYGSINVSVLLGNGNGTFQSAVNFGGGNAPISVAVGDFNGDGKADLAVGNLDLFGNGVYVLLGNGDGAFQTAVGYAMKTEPLSVAVADLNGDGNADLVLGSPSNVGLGVLLGNGDGTFGPLASEAQLSGSPRSVAVGDFNGDGTADLAVANGKVSVLLGLPAVAVPNVVGMTNAAATTAIMGCGLVVGVVTTASSNTVPAGSVTSESPTAGTLVAPGSSVNLVISGSQPISVGPSSGTAGRQSFSFVSRDGSGAGSIQSVQFLFSESGLTASNGCYIAYDPVGNVFYLLSDDGLQWYGLLAGSANTTGNAKCTIYGATSGSSKVGTDLTTTVDISFRSGFAGLKTIYQLSVDTLGNISGWQTMGTWNDAGDPNVLELMSLTPSSGTGLSQTFTTVVTDGNGATTIPFVELLMTLPFQRIGSFSGNGCFIFYAQASNTFFLLNDSATAFSGLPAGSAGSVSNSQCTLNGTGSGGVAAGSTLTVTYNLTFSANFGGGRLGDVIYLQAADNTGVIEVWHQMAIWNP